MPTLSVTGHRTGPKLGGYDNDKVHHIIKLGLGGLIGAAYMAGYTNFISGGATGIDQFFALEVLKLKAVKTNHDIHLTIARPFPSQHIKWPGHVQSQFLSICQQADLVVDVSPDPYAAWKMQTRNIWMVDRADRVLAVWDGTPGGTTNCVNYALQQNKPVIHWKPFEPVANAVYLNP
jgi:uncharacterized phage-like protein YoqJ